LGGTTRLLARKADYRTALQRPSKLFDGAAALAPTVTLGAKVEAGAGIGAAAGASACGNAA
jgi:hypothetical protein